MSYYQVKTIGQNVDGKVVKEIYIVQAESVTEVESVVTERTGNETLSATEYKVSEILGAKEDESFFYKVKVAIITIDEIRAKERKVTINVLVGANDIDGAVSQIHEVFNNCEIESITKTSIVDILTQKGEQ